MEDFTRVGEFMDSLGQFHVKGASVAVYHHGSEVYRYHWGLLKDSGKPMDDSALFRIYSMTKPITSVAALQLFERGIYLLSDPVSKYLPEFKDMKVAPLKGSGAYGWYNPAATHAITIQQLFTMTAGITYGGCFHPAEIETSRVTDELTFKHPEKCNVREFSKAVASAPLMFEPGTHWNYSYCMDIMGALIEVWSGMSFGEYLKKNIFEPLGMEETFFKLPEDKADRLSDYWKYDEGTDSYTLYSADNRPLVNCGAFESGGAGLISSLSDYGKFAQMLAGRGTGANGARILGPATVDLMRRNQLTPVELSDYDWEPLKGYGYGLAVRTMMDPAAAGSPSSVGEFGWNGLPGPYVLADPARELAIVYMQQLDPNMEGQIQPRLRNIVYGCLED